MRALRGFRGFSLVLALGIPGALLGATSGAQAATVHGEGAALALPGGGGAGAVGLRLEGSGTAFAAFEGRGDTSGIWTGRATGGVDFFGGEGLDFTLGLFLGGVGAWVDPELYGVPTAGFEMGLGVRLGDLKLRYRHIRGGVGDDEEALCCGTDFCPFVENQLRLSYRVVADLQVYGEAINLTPWLEDEERQNAYGLGMRLSL